VNSTSRTNFTRQVPRPVEYKGVKLDGGYRLDLIVQGEVILELKCVEHLLRVHDAQLLTYLKLTGRRVGIIINFQCRNRGKGRGSPKGFMKRFGFLRASVPRGEHA
jgi:GxxExxY protein